MAHLPVDVYTIKSLVLHEFCDIVGKVLSVLRLDGRSQNVETTRLNNVSLQGRVGRNRETTHRGRKLPPTKGYDLLEPGLLLEVVPRILVKTD